MCNCINIEAGSYGNQVSLSRPNHMIGQTQGSAGDTICVDACLSAEIQSLWDLGISTTGCCCGHNYLPPFIGVIDEDIPKMKGLGYVVAPNETDLSREDGFKPKSC
ncbi:MULTISPECIES: hypothetical protein [unclassified Pedobacter]|uniref:hypothetical protein n=1 Tax=unclassified Pedobacter TaxID=2628915 RepID=UPI00142227FA|nr:MULTISPECIES: hypothetical protein [unclassified Pedobacter]NII81724.1 hypothetical protein [Pedobacter sp. SG908]NMN35728.1 hypothetical protein [Pedobacter sp. SG918]